MVERIGKQWLYHFKLTWPMNQLWLFSHYNLVSFFILDLRVGQGCWLKVVTLCCYLLWVCMRFSPPLSVSRSSLSGSRRHERRSNWEVWGLCQVEALVSECRRSSLAVFYSLDLSRWVWNKTVIMGLKCGLRALIEEVAQNLAFRRWITNIQCKVNLFLCSPRFIWTVYETAV